MKIYFTVISFEICVFDKNKGTGLKLKNTQLYVHKQFNSYFFQGQLKYYLKGNTIQ